jgi:chitin synthase
MHEDYQQDYAFDPEAHQQAAYHEPYQSSPQDIPLLARHSSPQIFYDPSQENLSRPISVGPEHAQQTGGQEDSGNNSLHSGNFGHLVYDCPVPPKLLRNIPHAQPPGRNEFTYMRYTAVTYDPEEFSAEYFTLRPQLFTQRRRTELFIVVTMYNEDNVLFARTITGVFKNIEYIYSLKGKHKGL